MFSNCQMLVKLIRRVAVVMLGTVVLVGCASAPVAYTKESFSVDSPYQKKVGVGAATACEAARRALLGDGYVIDMANSDNVKGRKAYHSERERSTFIEMSVVCVPDPSGSSLYANGLLSTYDVKKSAASASVGVSAIGSLSLPIGQSADSMVKISDETINDRGFYHRFFTAVDAVLVDIRPETPPVARPDAGRGAAPAQLKVATPPPANAKQPPVDTQNGASVPLLLTPHNPSSVVPTVPQTVPAVVSPQAVPLSTVPQPVAPVTSTTPATTPATDQSVPKSAAPTASTQTVPEQPVDSTLSTQPVPQEPQQKTPQTPLP